MAIRSRDDLIDYCFHQLGAPVVQVEVDEQQVAYCVDMAIERWQDVHCDGSARRFIPHTITQEDINRGYLVIPDKIISVIKVVPLVNGMMSNSLSGMGIFNPVYQYRLNDFWDILKGGVSVYNDVMTNLQLIQDTIQTELGIAFNRHSNKLYLELDWCKDTGLIQQNSIIVLECFTVIDELEAPKMYNDWWLKRYTTSLIKKQWGTNTKKYSGVQLPGNITINGQAIYQEALQEIAELEQELQSEYSMPPIFMVG